MEREIWQDDKGTGSKEMTDGQIGAFILILILLLIIRIMDKKCGEK